MSDDDLYPELTEAGKQQAQRVMDSFKDELLKITSQALDSLYFNVVTHIESDSWTNYRNTLLTGLRDYSNDRVRYDYDFKQVRQSILNEHRDEIINDLNQDLAEENDRLKDQIEDMRRYR